MKYYFLGLISAVGIGWLFSQQPYSSTTLIYGTGIFTFMVGWFSKEIHDKEEGREN